MTESLKIRPRVRPRAAVSSCNLGCTQMAATSVKGASLAAALFRELCRMESFNMQIRH